MQFSTTTTASAILALCSLVSAQSQIAIINKVSGTPKSVPSPPASMPNIAVPKTSEFEIPQTQTIFHALPLFQELSGGPWDLPNFRDFQPRAWEMANGAPRI